MKYLISFLFLINSVTSFAQKDSLQVETRYWEDQLYISVSYNTLTKQPKSVNGSGFSYGISGGYIKDIPFNIKGKWAAGIGLGYSYDVFSHDLLISSSEVFSADAGKSSNKFKLHTIEVPLQIRWRNSDATTYSFWRIYTGIRLGYNISNSFKNNENNQSYTLSNINAFNKFQTGLEFSAGYGAVNFYVYYGLTPMYKNAKLNGEKINTKIAKFGLIFYLL